MAPVGMVINMMGGFSSSEVGIISLVIFLILSITLTALCARCNRKGGNAYDVNGTTQTDGGTKSAGAGDPGDNAYSNWRDHKLPPSTLERSQVPQN